MNELVKTCSNIFQYRANQAVSATPTSTKNFNFHANIERFQTIISPDSGFLNRGPRPVLGSTEWFSGGHEQRSFK